MRRVTRQLSYFLIGLVVCFAAMSVYYEMRVRQTGDFYRQVAGFRDPQVQPTVLLVGDSRLAANVDATRLPPEIYNFSYPGETLRHLYLRIKFALETKPSIEYLVIGVEDVQFSDTRARLREALDQLAFADLVDLTEIYPNSLRFLLRHAALHYLPLINADRRRRAWDALLDEMRSAVGKPPTEAITVTYECGGLQFLPHGRWSDLGKAERKARASSEVRRLIGGSARNQVMHRVFSKILDLADTYEVHVIGLRSPVSAEYFRAAHNYYTASPLGFLPRGRLHAMLDYETLFTGRPGLFYNADHLDGRGAGVFTERLVADLRRLVALDRNEWQPCSGQIEPGRLVWPYHDVLSRWLATPACHNLSGSCGRAGKGKRRWRYASGHHVAGNG